MAADPDGILPDDPNIRYVTVTVNGERTVFPTWAGTLEEASELLRQTPNGPGRRRLKELVFPLMYGAGSGAIEPLYPNFTVPEHVLADALVLWKKDPQ